MNDIGGYFGYEIGHQAPAIHRGAKLRLKSGRSCLKWLAGFEQPKKILIPYYSCDALREGLESCDAEISFYEIDSRLEIAKAAIPDDVCLIYINYFGLKGEYAQRLETEIGRRLWLDQTHAFLFEPHAPHAWHFNSARKFFGVPDGAFLYAPEGVSVPHGDSLPRNTDYRFEHLLLRHLGRAEEGLPIFQENERRNGGAIGGMSELTESLLSGVDFNQVARKRRENFIRLHGLLGSINRMDSALLNSLAASPPFCYPYLPLRPIDRRALSAVKIFVPAFWQECVSRNCSGFAWERQLSREMLPLPVDHRYDTTDMARLAEMIRTYG